jgi:hypothetical protein
MCIPHVEPIGVGGGTSFHAANTEKKSIKILLKFLFDAQRLWTLNWPAIVTVNPTVTAAALPTLST